MFTSHSFDPAAVSQDHFQGGQLIADPIHGYIPFTVPLEWERGQLEVTEKDLIDSPWMQRLRAITQLQSARWVFPAAEHSRFQHALGAMHIGGRFARQLYPSLRDVEPGCPSLPMVEAVLRVSGLLHDIGHGPFCHFFDHNYLNQYGIGHEALGHRIIVQELSDRIRGIRRSPSGALASDEVLEPRYIAYLVHKKAPDETSVPRWLRLLKPILGGMYTADNLDYVLRDAYMCGVAIGPVDLGRLLHYTFFTSQGLTLHQAGIGAFTMFLTARLYLYTNVYFHRTTRAIDLHLREIFQDTMDYIFPGNPLDNLNGYQGLTDWSLLETVRRWDGDAHPGKRALGREWGAILQRRLKWKMAYDATLVVREMERRTGRRCDPEQFEARIQQLLPSGYDRHTLQLDVLMPDPRKMEPEIARKQPLALYDPATGEVCTEGLEVVLEPIPVEAALYRLYTTAPESKQLLAQTCAQACTSLEVETVDEVPE